MQLDLAGAVDQVQERRPAGPAARREPTGDAVALVGFLTGGQVLVGRQDRVDRLDAANAWGKARVVALAQPLELRPPLGDQLVAGRARLGPPCGSSVPLMRGRLLRGRRRSW